MQLRIRALDRRDDASRVIEFISSNENAWVDHHPLAWGFLGSRTQAYGIFEGSDLLALDIFGQSRVGRARAIQSPGFLFQGKLSDELLRAVREAQETAARDARAACLIERRPVERPKVSTDASRDRSMEKLEMSPGAPWGNMILPGTAIAHVLDLSTDHETLVGKMSTNHRRSLKRSSSVAAQISFYEGREAVSHLSEVRQMHEVTFARTQTSQYDLSLWSTLAALADLGRCSVAIVESGGALSGAVAVLHSGDAARYFIGGSTGFALEKGLYVRLHVELARQLSTMGVGRYNLGYSFPSMPEGKMRNIGEFKRRFGGVEVRYDVHSRVIRPIGYAVHGIVVPAVVRGFSRYRNSTPFAQGRSRYGR